MSTLKEICKEQTEMIDEMRQNIKELTEENEKLSEQYNKMLEERNSLIDDLSWYKAKVSRLERENERYDIVSAESKEEAREIANKPKGLLSVVPSSFNNGLISKALSKGNKYRKDSE
ncbi:MAG: hypothetical protein L0L52_10445 [Staphylococcus equorum]|uniref:hypothetical protein n=1 Tax=Staphylococcus TaxID=1279 RepID=UPI0025569FFA|nr:hypothetical protein [Staphylococcus equorum]MDK9870659.1 hypothetical protein [Staphylococcus equorum]MDK9876057.1 hypothetical protein [Staphylococcus equorum]MDN6612126.1 hypothetical protein [Staphylococcus equorum]MDN6722650.1 hypothetical protein [Staphylococcus equorum]MDN6741261.1 hypothetical protein [Staphylococcus equorum]